MSEKQITSTFARYRRLLPYLRPHWRALAAVVLLTALTPVATSLAPLPMKLLVDHALAVGGSAAQQGGVLHRLRLPPSPVALIALAAGASLGLYLISSLLETSLTFTWSGVGQRMVADLAADLFQRMQRLTPVFHTRTSVGDLLSRLTGDAWCVYTLCESLLFSPWQNVLTIVTVSVISWKMDPVLAMVSLAVAPALAAVAVFYGPRLKRRTQAHRKTESQLLSFVHQTLSAVPLVQAFNAQERNRGQFHQYATSAVALSQRNSLLKNSYAFMTGLLTTTGIALVLYAGAQRVLSGAMTIGSLLVFIAYLRTLQAASQNLLQMHGTVKATEASLERVLEVLDSSECIAERPGAVNLPAANGAGLSISFQDVTFGYDADRPVLHDVTIDIAAGSMVALVGPTGAGKSTMASLVPRLMDAWSGQVSVGGRHVRDLTLSSLRAAIAVVPQEPVLLPASVRDNIAFGRPDATTQQIELAADRAHATEFIVRLPSGYDTILGERGATLSTGQRQRLAIARALLCDAPILILDEPTSALDASAEASVVAALRELRRSRTCIVIAHRLSTVREADQVAVLENGRLVELATPAELLSRGSQWAPSRLGIAVPAGVTT